MKKKVEFILLLVGLHRQNVGHRILLLDRPLTKNLNPLQSNPSLLLLSNAMS
jgi:hypothetical protein